MQRNRKMWLTHKKKGVNRNCFWGGLDLNLIDKDDKDVTSILNMLNELKKKFKELKGGVITLIHQEEHINENIQIIF